MDLYTYIYEYVCLGEGNGTPLQYSCLENPMDRGTWWAAVHGVAKSRTRLSDFTSLSCTGEGNGTPLQCSCLENPRDGGAWWAAVYEVAQSQTQLKRLSSSSRNIHQSLNSGYLPGMGFQCFISLSLNELFYLLNLLQFSYYRAEFLQYFPHFNICIIKLVKRCIFQDTDYLHLSTCISQSLQCLF